MRASAVEQRAAVLGVLAAQQQGLLSNDAATQREPMPTIAGVLPIVNDAKTVGTSRVGVKIVLETRSRGI